MDFSPLFEPLAVGHGARKIVLKNRMVMAPMITRLAGATDPGVISRIYFLRPAELFWDNSGGDPAYPRH